MTSRSAPVVLWLGARATAESLVRGAALIGEGRSRVGRFEPALPYVRGVMLAIPLVLVFSVLFGSADAVFARVVRDALDLPAWLDLRQLCGRLALGLAVAWLAAGGLHVARNGIAMDGEAASAPVRVSAGQIEAAVIVATLDLLFAFFAVLQLAYLFGGGDTLDTAGMTYSTYARRGFFELIVAAGLVGAVVLALEQLRLRSRALDVAELVFVGLTALVLVSAAYRLQLYQSAYGWSELRAYTFAAIAWLGLCLVAAALALARDAGRWRPHAVVLAGFVVAAGTNLIGGLPSSRLAQTSNAHSTRRRSRRTARRTSTPPTCFRSLTRACPRWSMRSRGSANRTP